jgi:hypothetical protein
MTRGLMALIPCWAAPYRVIISCSAGLPAYAMVMPRVRKALCQVVGVIVASYPVKVRLWMLSATILHQDQAGHHVPLRVPRVGGMEPLKAMREVMAQVLVCLTARV